MGFDFLTPSCIQNRDKTHRQPFFLRICNSTFELFHQSLHYSWCVPFSSPRAPGTDIIVSTIWWLVYTFAVKASELSVMDCKPLVRLTNTFKTVCDKNWVQLIVFDKLLVLICIFCK